MEALRAEAQSRLQVRLEQRRARAGKRRALALTSRSRESECFGLVLRGSYCQSAALRATCTCLATVPVGQLCEASGGWPVYSRLFIAPVAAAARDLAAGLRTRGFALLDDFLPQNLAAELACYISADVDGTAPSVAGVHSHHPHPLDPDSGGRLHLAWRAPTPYAWRDDVVAWVTPAELQAPGSPACFRELAVRMVALRRRLGSLLRLREEEEPQPRGQARGPPEGTREREGGGSTSTSASTSSTASISAGGPSVGAAVGEPFQLACFRPGPSSRGYSRHVDEQPAAAAADGRRVTVTLYLTAGWQAGRGGELRVWPRRGGGGGACECSGACECRGAHDEDGDGDGDGDSGGGGQGRRASGHPCGASASAGPATAAAAVTAVTAVDVAPVAGRAAVFLSGAVWHQVRPWRLRDPAAKRIALTAWFH
jgi:hypothetical protein